MQDQPLDEQPKHSSEPSALPTETTNTFRPAGAEHAREDETTVRRTGNKKKKGKAKMREYGNVSIPQEAFIAALRMGEE